MKKESFGIDKLYQSWPDVPQSIILKVELLRVGLRIEDSAIEAFRGMNVVEKGYHLFSYDRTQPVVAKEGIPTDFFLRRDDTFIQLRRAERSPYSILKKDAIFYICETGEPMEEIYFRPPPAYYSKSLADGTPMAALVQSIGKDMLFVTFDKYCEMWKDGNQCLFCDFNVQTQTQKKAGEIITVHKDPVAVAETLAVAFQEPGVRHLMLTGGSILSRYKEKTEIEYYCERLELIREKVGVWYPTSFQMRAAPKDIVRRIHDTGVTCYQPNMEVWDKRLFKIICPGKEKYVGYDQWIKWTLEAVDIFGPGRVVPNFVTGVEMAKPFGFEKVKDAVKSTLEGFDFLMSHGVLPRMDTWCVEPNSALGNQELPPTEYYIELGRGYQELTSKYGLKYLTQCRGCYRIDTLFDWYYYLHKDDYSQKGSKTT